jgi:hypothetical protein
LVVTNAYFEDDPTPTPTHPQSFLHVRTDRYLLYILFQEETKPWRPPTPPKGAAYRVDQTPPSPVLSTISFPKTSSLTAFPSTFTMTPVEEEASEITVPATTDATFGIASNDATYCVASNDATFCITSNDAEDGGNLNLPTKLDSTFVLTDKVAVEKCFSLSLTVLPSKSKGVCGKFFQCFESLRVSTILTLKHYTNQKNSSRTNTLAFCSAICEEEISFYHINTRMTLRPSLQHRHCRRRFRYCHRSEIFFRQGLPILNRRLSRNLTSHCHTLNSSISLRTS